MARRGQRPRLIPELEAFVVCNVQPTGVELGNGAYGAVEEVRIPGAICAARRCTRYFLNQPRLKRYKCMCTGCVCVCVSVC